MWAGAPSLVWDRGDQSGHVAGLPFKGGCPIAPVRCTVRLEVVDSNLISGVHIPARLRIEGRDVTNPAAALLLKHFLSASRGLRIKAGFGGRGAGMAS